MMKCESISQSVESWAEYMLVLQEYILVEPWLRETNVALRLELNWNHQRRTIQHQLRRWDLQLLLPVGQTFCLNRTNSCFAP